MLNHVCCTAHRHAREQQARQRALLPDPAKDRYGTKGPSVAMAWRVGGQYLRLLKVVRPILVQQALQLQRVRQLQQQVANGPGCYAGLLGRRLELGSMQHPFHAEYLAAAQQGQRGSSWQHRGSGAAVAGGVAFGEALGAAAAALGDLRGLTLG